VSPWPRKELRVVMYPDHMTLQPVRRTLTLRGLRHSIHDPQTEFFQAAPEAQPWGPALFALETALPALAKGPTVATVVLSNRFVRYAVVPWRAGLADAQEDLSYARHCFTKVYGKAAAQWEMRLSRQPADMPRVASAVDPELLDGLRSVCRRAGVRLGSIQPHLMVGFNRARGQLRHRSAWLTLLEPGHLCLTLLHNGHWSRVRNLRIEGSWREELPWLLEREAFLADDAGVPHEVYVETLDGGGLVLPEVDPWQFHALVAGPASDAAAAPGGHLTVATAG
jgi:hypothetical protein